MLVRVTNKEISDWLFYINEFGYGKGDNPDAHYVEDKDNEYWRTTKGALIPKWAGEIVLENINNTLKPNSMNELEKKIRTFEIFTEKYSKIIQDESLEGAIVVFYLDNPLDRIIRIDDRTFIESTPQKIKNMNELEEKIKSFIDKWNVAFEDREQQMEFNKEMREDILELLTPPPSGKSESELKEIRHNIIKKHIEKKDSDNNEISIFFDYHNAMIEYAEIFAQQKEPEGKSEKPFRQASEFLEEMMLKHGGCKNNDLPEFRTSREYKIMIEMMEAFAKQKEPSDKNNVELNNRIVGTFCKNCRQIICQCKMTNEQSAREFYQQKEPKPLTDDEINNIIDTDTILNNNRHSQPDLYIIRKANVIRGIKLANELIFKNK